SISRPLPPHSPSIWLAYTQWDGVLEYAGRQCRYSREERPGRARRAQILQWKYCPAALLRPDRHLGRRGGGALSGRQQEPGLRPGRDRVARVSPPGLDVAWPADEFGWLIPGGPPRYFRRVSTRL